MKWKNYRAHLGELLSKRTRQLESLIADMHLTLEELQESETFFRKLFEDHQANRDWEATFDAMTDLIVILDMDYRIVRTGWAEQRKSVPGLNAIKLYTGWMSRRGFAPIDYCLQIGPSTPRKLTRRSWGDISRSEFHRFSTREGNS